LLLLLLATKHTAEQYNNTTDLPIVTGENNTTIADTIQVQVSAERLHRIRIPFAGEHERRAAVNEVRQSEIANSWKKKHTIYQNLDCLDSENIGGTCLID